MHLKKIMSKRKVSHLGMEAVNTKVHLKISLCKKERRNSFKHVFDVKFAHPKIHSEICKGIFKFL